MIHEHTVCNLIYLCLKTNIQALKVSDHYPVEVELRCEEHGPIGWNVFPRVPNPLHRHHGALQPRGPVGPAGSQELIPESELPPMDPLPQSSQSAHGPISMNNQSSYGSVSGGNQSLYPTFRSDLQPYRPGTQDANTPYDPAMTGHHPEKGTPTHGILPFQGNNLFHVSHFTVL